MSDGLHRRSVRWADKRNPKIETWTRVLLVDGETTVRDIPAIIACRFLTRGEAGYVAVLEVTR